MKDIRKIKVCSTVFSKGMGLRFKKKIVDEAYVFPFDKPVKATIDMFFVHFPIDMIFLDKDKKIIEIKEDFKPYKFYFPKNKFSFLVELPNGYVKKQRLKIGKKVEF
ncbi:hypothetical protein C0585_00755 [Candidatus Woesearchaeota archaeon]|nr:MAG: hypothetical protein C0585_00755 [Candidatus Woesearchaeota archaeon]